MASADPGDTAQASDCGLQRLQLFVDPSRQRVDHRGDAVDAVDHRAAEERVVVAEPAYQRVTQGRDLRSHPSTGEFCEDLGGSRSPAISASIIARPETPRVWEATDVSLMPASSRNFSSRVELAQDHVTGNAACIDAYRRLLPGFAIISGPRRTFGDWASWLGRGSGATVGIVDVTCAAEAGRSVELGPDLRILHIDSH
ncbi:hypothetical protein [Krasilnikovia sp. M28-CT-15]|uniref:hypothetical protein n=1 Tax=Krasilnikovia sp. M28-CT-15 TaxID=3373540 RepID=UPI00399D2D44